jgi:hypothetical protein
MACMHAHTRHPCLPPTVSLKATETVTGEVVEVWKPVQKKLDPEDQLTIGENACNRAACLKWPVAHSPSPPFFRHRGLWTVWSVPCQTHGVGRSPGAGHQPVPLRGGGQGHWGRILQVKRPLCMHVGIACTSCSGPLTWRCCHAPAQEPR